MMLGNVIEQLFDNSDNAPLGAAVSVVMMLVVTLVVCALLWGTGYRNEKLRLDKA
jgi:spermidine/putrescine transport system permease protein